MITTQVIEEVECRHISDVHTTADGDTSTCRVCGQESFTTDRGKTEILKRGYINGLMTKVHPNNNGDSIPAAGAALIMEDTSPLATKKQPRRKPHTRKNLVIYLKNNKDAIIADYYSLTVARFLQKWHMSTSTWQTLKKAWNVKTKGHSVQEPAPGKEPDISTEQSLPPFPPFSDIWSASVQVTWLQTYKEISLARR